MSAAFVLTITDGQDTQKRAGAVQQAGNAIDLGRRGGQDWPGELDYQGGPGADVRDLHDRAGVLVWPLARIVRRWLAARPGKAERYADSRAHDDQADCPGDAAPAGLAVARD